MKKLLVSLLPVVFAFLSLNAKAQKFCYVSSEYILSNIPDYKTAQTQLDQLSAQWQKEIDNKYSEIDRLYKAYQAEQILLSDEMKKRREDEIINKEKEAKDYQKQKFGYEGDLFKKRQELVKPIQDKVYAAIKKYAEDNTYSVIFDKSGELVMLYSAPKIDKSDDILKALGISVAGKEKTTNKK